MWESNPPPACLEPDTGFEVRGVHRRRKRFREANYLSDQQKECTTGGVKSARVSPFSRFEGDSGAAGVRLASQERAGLELEPQERQGRPELGGLGVDAADALIVKQVGGLRPLEESPVLVVVAEA